MEQAEKDIFEKVQKDSAKSYLKITAEDNIKINPPGQRQFEIDGLFPDIIVKLRTGEIILESIETESTVNEDAVAKWRDLSNLGHELRILVPLSKIDIAKGLAASLTIPVNLQAYSLEGDKIQWFGKNT